MSTAGLDPVTQAVARALVGEISNPSTEWCVFVGDNPEDAEHRMVGLSREYAEELRGRINAQDFTPGSFLDCVIGDIGSPARIARREHWSTGRTHWQVVDTEGGEPS